MELTVAVVSLIASLAAVGISLYTFRKTHRAAVQPMLVFVREPHESGRAYFHLVNVGPGPALNVLVSEGDHSLEWKRDETVLYPVVTQEDRKRLGWLRSRDALVATYSNIYGDQYTTVAVDNRHKVFDGNRYPDLGKSHVPAWRLEEDPTTGAMQIPPESAITGSADSTGLTRLK